MAKNILVVDDSELCNKYLIKIENKIIKEGKPKTLYNKIINNDKKEEKKKQKAKKKKGRKLAHPTFGVI